MKLTNRSYDKELLDADGIPFEDIRQNMAELDFINTWLGGHGISIRGFQQLIQNKKNITLCEIGCGGGDNLVAIAKWCIKKNITVQCIGIDIKKECIDVAKLQPLLQNNAQWLNCDYVEAKFITKPDIIFSSLFCHHFSNEELISQFQWMQQNCTLGFFINDLQRNTIAYHLIKMLSRLFSRSYLVKHDAPLSVARGFHKTELINLLQKAGMHNSDVSRKWAFRYLLIYKHGA